MKIKIIVWLSLLISTNVFAANLECDTVYPLMNGFLGQHVNYKKLTPELEARTIKQFIKLLDPSKLYFMASDVATIQNDMTGLFTKIGSSKLIGGPKCDAIENAYQTYLTRVLEADAYAKKTLGPDFKFDESTTIVIDPAKREYSKDRAALEDIQNRYLQFQISNYLASDMKLAEARKQLIHRYDLVVKHAKESKKRDLFAIYLDAFASALDPHSNFLSKDVLEDFEITMRLSLEGIGATLSSQDGYTVVENLIPGGAAAKSGEMEVKDKIISVAQGNSNKFEPVIDMPLRDVVKLIRGKKGTKVRLTVLRQGKTTSRLVVDLIRDKIDLKDEAAKISYVDKDIKGKKLKIGIINLPSFYADSDGGERSCYEDVKKLLKDAADKKVDGIVLDLSHNGGGVLGEAVRLGGLFIKKGNIVETQDSNARIETLSDLDSTINYAGPLVVLTSRLSASASEIVAGALKDYKRAVIIGSDHTFGKGTVQAVLKLREDLGAIKVTTGMFFVPGGYSTQEHGVISDVTIPSPYVSKEFSEDSLDYALSQKSLPPFLSPEANDVSQPVHFSPINSTIVGELQKASHARVSKDPEFTKIETELKDSEKKNGVVKLADVMKKSIESNAKDKEKEKKSRKAKLADEAEYLAQASVKEAENIAVDLILLQQGQVTLADKEHNIKK